MSKKILAALLAVMMVLTVVPMTAGATEAEGTEANPITITADTAALENGKYYKLEGQVTLSGQITVADGVTTHIDLASGTLTAASGKYAIQVNTGGTLHVTGTGGTIAGSTYGALRNSGGTVTIDGGTFTSSWRISVKNEDGAKDGNQVDGNMAISGGTFICNTEPMDQAVQNFCKLTISGGEFRGKVVTWQEVATNNSYADYGDTTITGGTFKEDVLIAQTKDKAGTNPDRAPKLAISGVATKFEKDVGFFEGNTDATTASDIKGTLTIKEATVAGTVYNGSQGTVEVSENAKVHNVSNKLGGKTDGAAGTGTVAVKDSIITGTIDESVGVVAGCTTDGTTPIPDVANSNKELKLELGKAGDAFPWMCTVKISGGQEGKIYFLRIAESEAFDESSVIIPLAGETIKTMYTLACKSGKHVTLWELNSRSDIIPGSQQGTYEFDPLTERTLTTEYVAPTD